jgi:protein phosphatase
VSVDHSVVQEMVDTGSLTASEAATDRRRNVVTRAIGAGGASDPDFWMLPVHPGDRLLVCSDGLTGEVGDAAIEAVLRSERDPQVAADRLVAAAREAGGRDNITAVVVDAVDVEEPDLDDDTRPREPSVPRTPG